MVIWASPDDGGTVVDLWVVPGASRDSVDGPHGSSLKVRVAAPAERGRANDAVVALLSRRLGAPVELLAGAGGRRKRVRVAGLEPDEVVARLSPRSGGR